MQKVPVLEICPPSLLKIPFAESTKGSGKCSEWQKSGLAIFYSLWSHIAVSCSTGVWISQSGAWNDIMIYTQSSWQTKSDGKTRSCFQSGNRMSLSLYTEEESPGRGRLYWLSVSSGSWLAGSRAEQSCALCFTVILIKDGWVINVRFVAVRRVKLIKVGGHRKAQIPVK